MAILKEALTLTLKHEGGYVNDPTDSGGETIFGISRKNNPTWTGWKYVDAARSKLTVFSPAAMSVAMKPHMDLVEALYRDNYWKPCKLDEVKDQDTANLIFDMAVNHGVSRAIKLTQAVLPGCNVDGIIGPQTIRLINSNDIVNELVRHRCEFYWGIVEDKPEQIKYIKGWTNRAMDFVRVK